MTVSVEDLDDFDRRAVATLEVVISEYDQDRLLLTRARWNEHEVAVLCIKDPNSDNIIPVMVALTDEVIPLLTPPDDVVLEHRSDIEPTTKGDG